MSRFLPLILLCLAAACGREDHLGKPPSFNPPVQGTEYNAMMSPGLPMQEEVSAVVPGALIPALTLAIDPAPNGCTQRLSPAQGQ